MSEASKGTSWFSNGSSALTSGFSLVSAIVNEVSQVGQSEEETDGSTDDHTAQMLAEFKNQLQARDAHIKALESQLVSLRNAPSSPSTPSAPDLLEQQNQTLKEKLAKAVGHLKPLVEENRNLKAKVAQLESNPVPASDDSILQQELQSLKSKHESLLAQKEVDQSAWTESLQQSEAEITSLKMELNSSKLAWEKERTSLTADFNALNQEVDSLQQQVNSLKKSEAGYLDSLDRLKIVVSELESEKATHQDVVNRLNSEKSSIESRLTQSTAQLTDLEAQVAALKQEAMDNQQHQSLSSDYSAELETVKESHAATAKSLQQAQEKVTKLATKLKQTLELNQSLQKQLKDTTADPADIINLQSQLTALQATLEQTQTSLTDSQKRESELSQQLQESIQKQQPISSINNNNNKDSNEIESLTEELEFLKSEIEDLQTHNTDLLKSLKDSQEARSGLESSLQQALEQNQELEAAVTAASNSQPTTKDDKDGWGEFPTSSGGGSDDNIQSTGQPTTISLEVELQIQTLKTEKEGLERQISDLHAKAHKQSDKLAQTVEASRDLSAQVDELSATIAKLTNDLDTLMEEKSEVMQKNHDLERQVEQSIANLETMKAELEAAFETERAQLAEANRLEIERLESTTLSASITQTAELSSALASVTAERDSLLSQLESSVSLVANLESKIATLETEIKSIQASQASVTSQLEHANQIAISEKLEFDALRAQLDGVVDQMQEVLVQFVDALPMARETGGVSGIVDVDGFDLIPLSLKSGLNRFKFALDAVVVASAGGKARSLDSAAIDTVKSEYEQIMVDLNMELEDKNRTLHELQNQLTAVTEEKDKVSGEYAILMDKLKTFKNTVAPKLQEEMDSNKSLRAHVEQLTQQIANLNDEKSLLKTEISELTTAIQQQQQTASSATTNAHSAHSEDEVAELQDQITSLSLENEKLSKKLQALQHHMAESEEIYTQDLLRIQGTCDEYKMQLDSLERERENWESMASEGGAAIQIAQENAMEAQNEAMEAKMLLEEAIRNRERDLVSLNNLQGVLEEFQASKQAEIELAIETISKQLATATKSLQEYRTRAEQAELQLSEIDQTSLPNAAETQIQLQEKNAEIGKLRGRVISLETYLSEAIRRAASAENQVDRRLVSNLVVSFLSAPRGDSKRFEMLTVIASVLKLSDEDKVKIGLLRKVGGSGAGGGGGDGRGLRSPTGAGGGVAGESFTDLWISFLIKEAGTGTPQPGSGAASAEDIAGSVTAPAASPADAGIGNGVPKRPSSTMGFFGGWGGEKKSS